MPTLPEDGLSVPSNAVSTTTWAPDSARARPVATRPTGHPEGRALPGYSLGDVVADLSCAARSPLTLELEQVFGHGLLDPRCLG